MIKDLTLLSGFIESSPPKKWEVDSACIEREETIQVHIIFAGQGRATKDKGQDGHEEDSR